MICGTVSSQSCFFWLYRAYPSLAAKNIVNLILVLAIWWYPSVESSLVLLEEGVCYDQCVLLAQLLPLPCFILYYKGKFACYSRCFLTSYFCIPVPYNDKDIFFGCSKRSWPGIKPMSLASQVGFFLGSLRKSLQWLLNFLAPNPPVYLLYYSYGCMPKITPILQYFYLPSTA